MPLYENGRATENPITDATVFDRVYLQFSASSFDMARIAIHNSSSPNDALNRQVGELVYSERAADRDRRYTDAEAQIVIGRVRAGTAEVRYGFSRNDYPGIYEEDLDPHLWHIITRHPFHMDNHREEFFKRLSIACDYDPPTDRHHGRFIFPGIVDSSERTYYRREDSPPAPDVRALADLPGAGWTRDVPRGTHRLYSIRVMDSPAGLTVGSPERAHHRRHDLDAAIVEIARTWFNFWRRLPVNEQALDSRQVVKRHVEHAIGRCWVDRPMNRDIDVFHDGQSGSRERDARSAEDWMLGNLEQWAQVWGFAALVNAIATNGTNRSLLSAQLDDYTFCHVDQDGAVTDRLSNGADGITEATWNSYQTNYVSAVNHGLEGLATESLTIIVHQGTTETAQLVVTGGLEPYTFALTNTQPWASIDAATGELTVAPDAAVAVQDYTLRVRVDDHLGVVRNQDVTVTVRAANE